MNIGRFSVSYISFLKRLRAITNTKLQIKNYQCRAKSEVENIRMFFRNI